jgi:hypothetical protein
MLDLRIPNTPDVAGKGKTIVPYLAALIHAWLFHPKPMVPWLHKAPGYVVPSKVHWPLSTMNYAYHFSFQA